MILCPSCHEENPPKFRLCGYCGTPLHPAEPAAAPAPPREVRRTVTIVFCDLKDSTSLGERLDPEALHEVKDRYFKAMAAEIARHGGKIEKYIGDAIMAVFGLPVQHEDDALRAVRAAAGMQLALRDVNAQLADGWGVELKNRTGVNTGEVVATDDPSADQKLATGDAVNVAARLEQAAPPNEIYLGEATWRLVRDAVQVEAVEPLELKGKQERVPAFRLVSASGHAGAVRRHDTPIVGRDDELWAIDQALQEVRDTASARLITLIGDAGIGKSRLAEEVIVRAGAAARVVRGRCLAYGDGITFWPVRGMVSEAAGIATEDPPELAFGKVLRVVGDAEVAQRLASAIGLSRAAFPIHETSWAVRKFLAKLAEGGSAVALIDDIHWAEPAFLEMVEAVVRAEDTAPVLLLCTARHELLEKKADWGEGERALRLVLRPLSDAAAASVAHNVLGQSGLPPAVVTRIVAAAEGNPLYVEHMLSMLVESQVLELRDGRWALARDQAEITVPPTIKALLESRIGQLRVEERSAIEPASVVGLQFPVPAVASMTPERFRPSVEQHLVALTRKQLVTAIPQSDEDVVYKFHHHLVRETIYNGLLKRTRATLHVDFVRWADRVNAERGRALEFEEILGYHLETAQRYLRELGPLDEKGKAIGRDASARLSSAGRRAFARGDLRAAGSLLRRALAALADGDTLRLPLLPELGEVLLDLGELADARTLVDEALAAADPVRDRRVKASAEVVRLLLQLHGGETVDWTEAAAALMRDTIPALVLEQAHGEIAKAWRVVALVQQNSGRLAEASDSIAKVVEHARLAGDQRLVARSALGLTLSALYGPTPVPQAIEQCEALIAEEFADRQVQNLIVCKIAQLRAMNGDVDTARTMCRDARAVLRDLGPGVRAASASFDLAFVELLAGDAAAAERELRPDCDLLEKMGETYFLSSMAATLALAVREQARDDEALEITRLAERTAAPDDFDAQVLWRCTRAPILARAGALDEAEALARAAVEMSKETEVPGLQASAWTDLASVLRVRGDAEGSRHALGEALKIHEAKGDRLSVERLRASQAST
jgi:class 3 adenylate cyclase/tetratricopeptide (TPR) repeat protein